MSERCERYHEIVQPIKDLGSMAVVWAMDKILPREAVTLRDLDAPVPPLEDRLQMDIEDLRNLPVPDIAGRDV